MYLQNFRANVAICDIGLFFSSRIPKSRKYLSRKWMDETSRRLKSSDLIIYSSILTRCSLLMLFVPYSSKSSTIITKEGYKCSSIFAAISKHVTASVTRHGDCYLITPRCIMFWQCLSAILTAR